jgi:hypothetical protein
VQRRDFALQWSANHRGLFMRFSNNVVALVAALLLAAPVRAESPPPETLAAARDLVTTLKSADLLKSVLPTFMQSMKPAIVQGRPAVEKDYDALVPVMIDVATSRLSEYAELVARVYAVNFTTSELLELQAFYSTPIGQKLVAKLPTITQQSLVVGQQWGKVLADDLRARMTQELRKRGHDI